MSFDIPALASAMTDQDFELLLRFYVNRKLQDVPTASHATFTAFAQGLGMPDPKWTLAVRRDAKTYDVTSTTGDLLALCAQEAIRRQQADQANVLRLIEAPLPEVLDDELPVEPPNLD